LWLTRQPLHQATARRIALDDGDVLVVHDDCPADWPPGGRVALLVHGLVGSHRSPYIVRWAGKLLARGVRVFRLDLRGCGAGIGLAKFPYHAGCSSDLDRVVTAVIEWSSAEGVVPTLAICGVSLSGNILLKYLGETPDAIPASLVRAIAINPPIDLARSIATLDRSLNRWYDRHFTRTLLRHLERLRRLRPDAPMPATPLQSRRLYDFDDWYTAPTSGFPNAATYYARCSAAQFIPQIRVPTLVMTSRDDPLVPVAMFEDEQPRWPNVVQLHLAGAGGHVGYIARRGIDPDPFWLDWRIVEWVTAM
jgi:predicted alpha/beta-fold hydrolase